ncbi:MAG TPA: glycosyltransferase [Thermoanaerobaculia bacterium]|jgi:glycosyltransferase involved in cell wall biosynthesis
MHLSVVVATWNRARLLADTLEALGAQEVGGAFAWEIVLIDNNSSDATAQVVDSFAARSAVPVRRVFEPAQGLSHARNRGLREARGSILAFCDDDVLPQPDWVARVAAAIDRWNADGVGGRILPRFEAPPPPWLTENRRLMRQLALMDWEGSRLLALPFEPQPQVWGANMAFRRGLFERVGEFDARRGLSGRRLFRGEEVDLIERALRLGLRIVYDSALTVFHRIGPDRLRKAYFRRLAFDDGYGEARAASGAETPAQGEAFAELRKWAKRLLLRRPGAFDQELRFRNALGKLAGSRTRR